MQSLHQVVPCAPCAPGVLRCPGLDGKALNSPAVHLRPRRGEHEQGRRGAQRTAPEGRTGDRGAGRGAGGRGARSLISALSAAGRLHGARLAAGSYRRGACAFEWTLCTIALVLLHRELPWSRPNLCGAPVPQSRSLQHTFMLASPPLAPSRKHPRSDHRRCASSYLSSSSASACTSGSWSWHMLWSRAC